LDELGPYLRLEQYSLLYFVLIAIAVIILHILFSRLRFVKYLPGVVLIIYALIRLFLNKNGGFLKSSPEDLRVAVLTGACGLVSIFFARILAIMYKNKDRKRRPLTEEEKRIRMEKRKRREARMRQEALKNEIANMENPKN
ncbi:MAG: hypothetical protein ACLU31_01455, partial [Ezakiella sp.]